MQSPPAGIICEEEEAQSSLVEEIMNIYEMLNKEDIIGLIIKSDTVVNRLLHIKQEIENNKIILKETEKSALLSSLNFVLNH